MSALPACLLVVTADVDPEVEADWNRWYDEIHLPDALKCPGVKQGQRYVSMGQIAETIDGKRELIGKRLYTTIYELDSPEAIATPQFQAMRGWARFAPHVRSRTQVVVTTPR